ncbi:hypothetical protein T11_6979 [Trichinella zimbabwensis]|uniref:Uncharacterized protein n=1 Tax=Trichinella zimbabwensis TaxID=268475 RepID=A0A0V1HPJ1_9BILA|nr:hypothetical protein T11_6979 [Trichinella zimbabwensis]
MHFPVSVCGVIIVALIFFPFSVESSKSKAQKLLSRYKRQNLEVARYNRICCNPLYNAIYPYRTYLFPYTAGSYELGPFLTRPLLGSTGQIYECPLAYLLHRNTGYLQPMFNRVEFARLHEPQI